MSERVEEYKTQVVIPIGIRHKNYCDLNGKIIPTEFILDKEHFFYGGYGYIVLHDFANNSEAMKGVSAEDRLPNVKENGEKVLLYRKTTDSQKALAITIYDTNMVKYCEVGTLWTNLPTPPNQ